MDFDTFVRLFRVLTKDDQEDRKDLESKAKSGAADPDDETPESQAEDVAIQADFFFEPESRTTRTSPRKGLQNASLTNRQDVDADDPESAADSWQPPTPASSPPSVPATASPSASCSTSSTTTPMKTLSKSVGPDDESLRTGTPVTPLSDRERSGKRKLMPKQHIFPGEPGASGLSARSSTSSLSSSTTPTTSTTILIPKKKKRRPLDPGVRVPAPVMSPRPASGPWLSCVSFNSRARRPVRVVIDLMAPDAAATAVVKSEPKDSECHA